MFHLVRSLSFGARTKSKARYLRSSVKNRYRNKLIPLPVRSYYATRNNIKRLFQIQVLNNRPKPTKRLRMAGLLQRRRLASAVALSPKRAFPKRNRPPFEEIRDGLSRGAIRQPNPIDVEKECKRRKTRREVLFALTKGRGLGGNHRPPTYDVKSLVRC